MTNTTSNGVLKFFLIGCGSIAAVVVLIIAAGVIWLLLQPEAGVKLGNEMDKYAVKYIEDYQLLEPGEQVLAYYDATMSMDGTEAAILTDRRLMHHVGGTTSSMRLEEITDIRHRYESLTGDVIEAEDGSGKLLRVEIAPLNQGETFRNATMAAWKKARPTSTK